MSKKFITKNDLSVMFSTAKNNYVDNTRDMLTEQEFIAKCYLEAACALLGVGPVEFQKRPLEAAEE